MLAKFVIDPNNKYHKLFCERCHMTPNKIYELKKIDYIGFKTYIPTQVCAINDIGQVTTFYRKWFKTTSEEREEKINSILE